jgi:hypothetical protein
LEEKRVEPNSGLGEAINYMLKRWPALTLFLRQAGAPLDNNICERALKMAILHRNYPKIRIILRSGMTAGAVALKIACEPRRPARSQLGITAEVLAQDAGPSFLYLKKRLTL